jgi:hypothetical protein
MARHLNTDNPKAATHHSKDTVDSKATASPHHSRDMVNLPSSMEDTALLPLVRADHTDSLDTPLSRDMVHHLPVVIR